MPLVCNRVRNPDTLKDQITRLFSAETGTIDNSSAEQLNGDDSNARIVFDRYVHRLIPLVAKFIGPTLQARVDPEDIVQSAMRSVFRRAKEGRFELKRSGDLWRLLAAFAVNKARKRVEKELAGKRDPAREVHMNSSWEEAIAENPHDDEAEQLIEDVRFLAESLNDEQRKILDMRLADFSMVEIADEFDISYARVNRTLRRIEDFLRRRLNPDSE